MNLRKRILPLTLFLFLIIALISPFNVVMASTGTMRLNIKMERSSGYGYQLGNSSKNIWKIFDVDNDRNYTIYCLKGGPGFGSQNMFNTQPAVQTYTRYFDMRNPESIPTEYKRYYSGSDYVNILPEPDSQAYKSIMWILDNCFILPERNSGEPASSDITTGNAKRDSLIKAAKAYAQESYQEARSSDFDKLTDDDIDVVQQLAIWYYTNPDKVDPYHVDDTFELWLNPSKGDVTQTNTYQPLSERGLFTNGEARAKACQGLFYYLTETPRSLDYDYKNANNKNQTVQINDSEATMEVSNDRYIFGPYRLEKTGTASFEITGKVTYGTSDTVVQDVKYLNEGKGQVSESTKLSDMIGQKFYISVPNTIDYSKVKFSITGKYYTTEVNYWSVEAPGAKDQPVVKVEEKENTFTDETVFTPGEFDLALRKFIIKIGNQEIKTGNEYTREPKISADEISKLAIRQGTWNDGTTAEKKHPKDPLPVKTGDIVRYKIRIYNEGEIAGYATEVTDYLPDGLEFIAPGSGEGQSTVNETYGWHVDGDSKIVKTSYLQNMKIDAFNKQTIAYKDLEIECKVVAKAGESDSELKNIAEITAHKDEYGNTTKAKDRDSTPNNVQRNSYGVTSQQDDDDFERLVLSKVTPGKYELELEKVDSHDTSKKLQGVGFNVTITGESLSQNNDYTTDGQGKINITDISITKAETQTITITETKAPAGYSNQGAKIVITVQTSFEDGGYVVKSISSTGTIKSGATNSTELKGYTAELQGSKIVVKMKNYQLDLALRKFITTIDGTDVKNDGESTFAREPKITDEEKGNLAKGQGKLDNGTTAFKDHPKTPLQVHTGSRVIYTIRVYNEGEIAGYAKKVTDYLPEGLKFVTPGTEPGQSQINQTYGWKNTNGDGKTIETEHIANILIDAFNGSNLDYEDLKIECEVVAKPGETETQLKNIAEITAHSDEYGDTTVKDRDSVPHNVTTNNYGETSQQDDDDFERLVLPQAEGKYEIELEKVDSQNTETKLQGVIFEVKVDGVELNETGTYTTGTDGKISVLNIPIRKSGTQTVTIKETNAPTGYSNQEGTITLTVTTELKDGEYVVKEISSVGTIKQGPSNSTELKGYTAELQGSKIVVQMKNYKLDLALRKFITTIDGVDVKNETEDALAREPKITDEEKGKLANRQGKWDNGTTAEKVHPKDPLKVETGSKVIYTIRVYNEGEIAGYAKKVTDYLPEGLKFITPGNGEGQSQINQTYGWTNPNEDGRTIETNHIANTLIDAFNGSKLDYEDLKIECEVVAKKGENITTLTNIAEITLHSDEHGDTTVLDRDSVPNNVNKEGYGEESQQDDDDFERLMLEKATGKYNLELEKVDGQNLNTKLANAEFEITLPDETTNTYTTTEQGKITISDLPITQLGEQVITIKETKAPLGYSKNIDTITVKVTPVLDEGEYVVKTIEIEENSIGSTLTEVTSGKTELKANVVNGKIYVQMKNYQLDLALRKFIISIAGKELLAETTETPEETPEPTQPVPQSEVSEEEQLEPVINPEEVLEPKANQNAEKNAKNDVENNTEKAEPISSKETQLKVANTPKYSREPIITDEELEKLANGSASLDDGTTANKVHSKEPLIVETGDKVIYIIRVYNEGKIAGYATKVTDYLPEGLKFLPESEINKEYGWTNPNGDGKTIETDHIAKTLIDAFDGKTLDYEDLKVECEVVAEAGEKDKSLKNIAEITEHSDEHGDKTVEDRDSTPDNVKKDEYEDKSQEDDDDFEELILEKAKDGSYNLEIEKINGQNIREKLSGAEFEVTLPDGSKQTLTTNKQGSISISNLPITKLETQTITIRETKAPEGYSRNIDTITVKVTTAIENGKYVAKTIKIVDENSNSSSSSEGSSNKEDSVTLGSQEKDVTVGKTNITASVNNDTITVKVNNYMLDLALRKFITKVNDTDITNRVPVFTKVSETEFKYEHPKDPVQVAYGNIVTYTLRIFNEGKIAGYASKVKDDLPEGLTFLPDHETNVEYRWKMYTEEGEETNNIEEAKYIETDYLAKENEKEENANLLKAFDQETMTMPDYRDIKIAFRVSEPNTSDRIIINTAEITDDRDEHNEPVDDVDSTPDNDEPEEDDIDEEKIKVQYFDLSLKKWVSESIVTYGGKTTVTKTGHTGDENPEPPAKVEIRGSRIDKTTVKFKFVIKVTNEGEIAGYAKELIDYIPEGLKFDPKDNPLWREEDGKVLTDQLKDTLLQPGESAQVEIILTWINNKNNLGEKVNWAEIYKDDNEPHSPDIDSTPGNNEKGEDDIDRAPVILGVVTGSVPTYIGLVIIAVSVIAGGVVLIKKFVI